MDRSNPPANPALPDQNLIETEIAVGLEQVGLSVGEATLRRLALHLGLTLKWSRAISLTAIHGLQESVERHVVESVLAGGQVDPAAGRMLDIGSGNGYPGIPIKCLHPGLPTTLLEPALRKSVFLKEVCSALRLDDVSVVRGRIDRSEDLIAMAPLGTITTRAVAITTALLEGAVGALVPGGRLVLLVGMSEAEALEKTTVDGLRVTASRPLPGRKASRLLVAQRT